MKQDKAECEREPMENTDNTVFTGETESSSACPENVFEKELLIYEPEIFRCDTDYRNRMREPEPRFKRPAVLLMSCTLFLVVAFALYCIIAQTFRLKEGFYSPASKTTVILGLNSKPAPEILTDENGRYTPAGICEAVGPSVIEIIVYDDSPKAKPVSSGSGIILSEDGYIVSNAHVINVEGTMKVVLHDDTVFDAKVIGYDNKTDIGIIKIAPGTTKLQAAEFGNSDEVVQGEEVMAIGNPGGLHGSISGGYVSGINRMIRADSTGRQMSCIQTDAAISPGNSGGALVNMYGQIIGITSSKYVSSSYEGLGFAICINDAKPIIEELTANGFISGRFKVGITFYEITEEQSEASGLPQGLLIDTLDETCDISKSGLRKNDIIVEVEGSRVTDYDSFMDAINSHNKGSGDKVHAKAFRAEEDHPENAETVDFEFTLNPDTSGKY